MPEKLDLRKQYRHLYTPSSRTPSIVDVPEFSILAVDGTVAADEMPGTSAAYQAAIEALYGASYTLKFMLKQRRDDPLDYSVMALEGLWWGDTAGFDPAVKAAWHWTMFIIQPEQITPELLAQAKATLKARGRGGPSLDLLRLERLHEGLSVQMMHVGPYLTEPATLEMIYAFAAERGYRLRGKHHEIYISDPRRTAPEKLKTILRHPVEAAG